MTKEGENRYSVLETHTIQALRRSGMAHYDTLVVGVSGGPDSTALLRCLSRITSVFPLKLHVAHLNHDFRGKEADDDEAFVLDLAKQLGLNCTSEYQDTDMYQRQQGISSFEQGARELRYEFLLKVAREQQSKLVAVAHTADDLAETVLEHILRGSGLNGLRGMSEISHWPWPSKERKVKLFRPFLDINKLETSLYCDALDQAFRQDTTNDMLNFTRNRVRKTLMPLLASEYNPQIQNALIRLSRSSAIDFDYIEQEMNTLWDEMSVCDTYPPQEPRVEFDMRQISTLHPSMQRHLVRKAYIHVCGDTRRITEKHIAAVVKLIDHIHENKTIHLPFGLTAQSIDGRLCICRRSKSPSDILSLEGAERHVILPTQIDEPIHVDINSMSFCFKLLSDRGQYKAINPSGLTQYFSTNAMGSQATIRFWKAGDKFKPLGMRGHKKLQDFFTDAKVNRVQRHCVPIIAVDDEIVWVVGHRISDTVKIIQDIDATNILEITFKP